MFELWELLHAPDIRETLFGLSALQVETVLGLIDQSAVRPFGLWVARSRRNAHVLGCVSLCGLPAMESERTSLPPSAHRAELIVVVHPHLHGQGFASEALWSLLSHAFAELGLREVVAGCSAGKTRCLQLLRSLGFRATAVLPSAQGRRIEHLLDRPLFEAARAERCEHGARSGAAVAGEAAQGSDAWRPTAWQETVPVTLQ